MVKPTSTAFYEGKVRHRRLETKERSLSMRLFYTYVDIDKPGRLFDRIIGWSCKRPALFRYQESDYGPRGHSGLSTAIRDLVDNQLGFRPRGPVLLLTTPRNFRLIFNPISIYYCFESEDDVSPSAMVLEVTNTPWNDRHHYVIDARTSEEFVSAEFKKAMHVSPFFDMPLTYHLRASNRDSRINLRLELTRGTKKVFDADLNLQARSISNRSAWALAGKHCIQTFRVISAIYLHALVLLIKRVPFYSAKIINHDEKVSKGIKDLPSKEPK